jgi:hypothetical protein
MDSGPGPGQGQEPESQDPAYQPTMTGPTGPRNPPPQSPPPAEGGPEAANPYPYPGDLARPARPAPPRAPVPPPPSGQRYGGGQLYGGQFYGAQPPGARPRRGRRGWVIGAVVAVVAALAAGGVTAAVLVLRTHPETTAQMALQAGQAVAPAAGLTLTGSVERSAASVTVTRAGTVTGDYTQDGSRVSRATIGGVTYLKAPAAFWKDADDQTAARRAAGHWAKVPASRVLADFGPLTPRQVARTLNRASQLEKQHPRAARITFHGRKVVRFTEDGISYYVTASTPNQLIHVTRASGAESYSLDVTPLTAASISPVFTILHGDVQDFQGAPDPEAVVDLDQKIQFRKDCDASKTCTVFNKVTVSDPGSDTALLTMNVAFSGTRDGHPFATCAATVQVHPVAGDTVTPSCGLSHPVWSKWWNSHTGNFSTWASATFEVTVNTAGDIAALQRELDQEQAH